MRSLLSPILLAALLTLPATALAQSKTYTNGENNAAAVDTTGSITLTVNDADTATQSGVISGTGNVSKAGDGSLFLSGSNDYIGTTSVNAGILLFLSPNALYGADTDQWNKLTVASGATVAVDASSAGFSSAQITTLLNAASFTANTSAFEFYFADNHSLTQNTDLSDTGTPEVALTLTGSTPLNLAGHTLTLGAAANQNLAVSRELGGGQDGAAGGISGPGAPGGAGGSLVINQGNVTFNSAVNITGGAAGSNGINNATPGVSTGGTGGALTLSAGDIFFGETVSVSGGNGGAGGFYGGIGGTGGSIALTGATVTFDQDVQISGGKGGDDGGFNSSYGGTGGAAGSLNISGGTVVFNQALDLIGGQGGDGGSQIDHRAGVGGTGGSITLSDGVVTFADASSVNLSGGLGGLSVGATNYGRNASGALGTFTLSGGTLQLPDAGWLESSSTFIGNFAFTGGTFKTTDTEESLSLTGSSKLGLALANASVTADRILDLAGSLTYSGVVAGSGRLIKTGSGTLTLSGTNTYSGGTTVSAGTLVFTTDANLGDTSGDLIATSGAHLNAGGYFGTNRAITLDGSGTSLYNNGELIIGFGGTGSLTLTNGAAISAYNLDLAFNGGTGTVHISSGSTISAYNVIYYSPTSTINLNEGGTLTTAGISGTGIFNLAGGTLRSGGAYSSGQAATLTNASTIDTNGHATSLSGNLTGSGSLTKIGTGTLTLSGTNDYEGGTSVTAGTLAATGAEPFGTGAISVTAGGSVELSAPAAFTQSLTVDGNGSQFNGVDNNSPELELLDPSVATSFTAQAQDIAVAIRNGGTLTGTAVSFGAVAGQTADIQLTAGGTLTASRGVGLGGDGDVTFSIDGAGSKLTVGNIAAPTEDNVMIIGFNTGDAVSSLSVGNGGAVEADNILIGFNFFGPATTRGALTINDGGIVTVGTVSLDSNTGYGEELTINSGGTLTIVGGLDALTASEYDNVVSLNGGTLQLTTNAFSTSAGAILGADTTSTIHINGVDATLSGVVSGDGNLTKAGSGTLTLSGTNDYEGGTTISGGTLQLGSTTALGGTSSVDIASGATLDLNNQSVTIADLDGAGDITLGSANLTTGDANSHALSGAISGTGALTKSGTGNLTLTGTNTYSGGTTLSAGTLSGNATSLQGNIANNAALVFDQASTGTYAGVISGTGALTKSGAGTLTLSGANNYSGGTTIAAGTLVGNTTSLQGSITNNAAVVFEQDSVGTYSGTISGSGTLTKTGAGTLYLNAANTYTGATAIHAGTLRLGEAVPFASTSITVASAASLYVDADSGFTLDSTQTLGGSGTITGGLLTLGSGATLEPGSSPGTLTFTNGLTLDAGAILNFELGTVSDLIAVTGGTLTGPSSGTLTLNLSDSGGFAAGSYTLFDYTAATLDDFDVTDFALGTTLAGYDYSFNLTGTTLELVAATSAIPEPSTYAALLGLGALGLVAWRRKRAPHRPDNQVRS